jgi:3-oxoacyl-[acyl-carrier protein] reductase
MTEALNEDIRKAWVDTIPLKRGGTTDDVANACLFLASDLSTYITGQTLFVCGGLSLGTYGLPVFTRERVPP